MKINFGTAGTCDSFKSDGFKNYKDIPNYLNSYGLNAFEYQCGHGIRVKEQTAIDIGKVLKTDTLKVSLHAPYYISMSSVDPEKRDNSIKYILDSAKLADSIGATRVVVHTGSCSKISRSQALEYTIDTMKRALNTLKENGLYHINICPETMGKINQLGTLDEVLEICKIDDNLIPCIDFGHLNARTFGEIKCEKDYENILLTIKNKLGLFRFENFHSHFSKIEYTLTGGEKKHLTFEDSIFGPSYEQLLNVVKKFELTPTIICESAGTQAIDARTMKNYYNKLN
ncbi:MAG: TIM barrel protein [Oscillospiraceae bacterium]